MRLTCRRGSLKPTGFTSIAMSCPAWCVCAVLPAVTFLTCRAAQVALFLEFSPGSPDWSAYESRAVKLVSSCRRDRGIAERGIKARQRTYVSRVYRHTCDAVLSFCWCCACRDHRRRMQQRCGKTCVRRRARAYPAYTASSIVTAGIGAAQSMRTGFKGRLLAPERRGANHTAVGADAGGRRVCRCRCRACVHVCMCVCVRRSP